MERMNSNIPFEHQMMFIIKDYDKKVEEIHELRTELDELAEALEKFGGSQERISLMEKYKGQLQKNKILEAKLKERSEALETERNKNRRLHEQVNILTSTLGDIRNRQLSLLSMVEVPALRKLTNRITKVLHNYKKTI